MRYFVATWIGCDRVMQQEPIPVEYDDAVNGPYGLVDQWVRNWVQGAGLQGRSAVFRQELWNMCDRWLINKYFIIINNF